MSIVARFLARVRARKWDVDSIFAAIAATLAIVSGVGMALDVTIGPIVAPGDFSDIHGAGWVVLVVVALVGILMAAWGLSMWRGILRGEDIHLSD